MISGCAGYGPRCRRWATGSRAAGHDTTTTAAHLARRSGRPCDRAPLATNDTERSTGRGAVPARTPARHTAFSGWVGPRAPWGGLANSGCRDLLVADRVVVYDLSVVGGARHRCDVSSFAGGQLPNCTISCFRAKKVQSLHWTCHTYWRHRDLSNAAMQVAYRD